ncbi:lysozyme inhibitor LprI family protein [Nitrobacter sp. NHB1]|uniref:lysozyme inhibitor LprI family protein n=1 Tax=Nitrobacter sp. NHB1 TaxID=3119830 RepID=UPI002FFE43B0
MVRHTIAPAIMTCALMLLPAAPANASGPGFDCAKATRQIDKAICAWDTVGSLDGRMAAAYKKAIAAHDGEAAIASVKADQKAWLAERDRRCGLKTVKPREGSEEGLSPQQFGQLMCLQFIYPPRIAQLMDLAAPPLVPVNIKTVPIEPSKAAYPDDWQPAGYQAQFSPDKTLMALGVEDGAGYVKQVWLYQPASGRLAVASPRKHKGAAEKPEDISELNSWFWGDDGRFYVRARRPRGEDGVFGADMDGYAEMKPPPDVAEKIAASNAARKAVFYNSEIPEEKRPPGFNDDSYDEQKGGAFIAWAQNKGHGSFDVRAARNGDEEPRIITSGSWELKDFQLDPSGTRLFYNGDDGLVVTDPDSRVTRRLKGTRGGSTETRPINMSADGDILIYWASGSCTRDATEETGPDADDDSTRRVCLAYLEAVGSAPTSKPISETLPATANTALPDPWVGKWEGSGNGSVSATIRRGTAKPDYLVIDLVAGMPGCSGAVTLYGKPEGNAVLVGESYEPNNRDIPVCRVKLSLDSKGVLTTEVAGPCTLYHGGSCGFDGSMTRSK